MTLFPLFNGDFPSWDALLWMLVIPMSTTFVAGFLFGLIQIVVWKSRSQIWWKRLILGAGCGALAGYCIVWAMGFATVSLFHIFGAIFGAIGALAIDQKHRQIFQRASSNEV